MKKLTALLAAAMLMMGMATAANALSIYMSSGTDEYTFSDNGPGDLSSDPGFMLINQAVGNFMFNSQFGLSNGPGSDLALLDLNSGNTSVNGTGQLLLAITDTNYSLAFPALSPNAIAIHGIGGTTKGVVSWELYADSSNAEFGLGTLLGSGSADGRNLPGNAFSSSLSQILDLNSPFSLTQIITIDHFAHFDTSTFNTQLEVVPTPEPGTILLLGGGLLGLGIYGRRRAKK